MFKLWCEWSIRHSWYGGTTDFFEFFCCSAHNLGGQVSDSWVTMARVMICCSCSSPESQSSSPWAGAWPVIFFISHLRIPELFSLLTTVFRALLLVKFFSEHRSFSGEFSFMFFMIVFMVSFPLGISCTKRLKLACRWQWGKTGRFPSFRFVASPDIV